MQFTPAQEQLVDKVVELEGSRAQGNSDDQIEQAFFANATPEEIKMYTSAKGGSGVILGRFQQEPEQAPTTPTESTSPAGEDPLDRAVRESLSRKKETPPPADQVVNPVPEVSASSEEVVQQLGGIESNKDEYRRAANLGPIDNVASSFKAGVKQLHGMNLQAKAVLMQMMDDTDDELQEASDELSQAIGTGVGGEAIKKYQKEFETAKAARDASRKAISDVSRRGSALLNDDAISNKAQAFSSKYVVGKGALKRMVTNPWEYAANAVATLSGMVPMTAEAAIPYAGIPLMVGQMIGGQRDQIIQAAGGEDRVDPALLNTASVLGGALSAAPEIVSDRILMKGLGRAFGVGKAARLARAEAIAAGKTGQAVKMAEQAAIDGKRKLVNDFLEKTPSAKEIWKKGREGAVLQALKMAGITVAKTTVPGALSEMSEEGIQQILGATTTARVLNEQAQRIKDTDPEGSADLTARAKSTWDEAISGLPEAMRAGAFGGAGLGIGFGSIRRLRASKKDEAELLGVDPKGAIDKLSGKTAPAEGTATGEMGGAFGELNAAITSGRKAPPVETVKPEMKYPPTAEARRNQLTEIISEEEKKPFSVDRKTALNEATARLANITEKLTLTDAQLKKQDLPEGDRLEIMGERDALREKIGKLLTNNAVSTPEVDNAFAALKKLAASGKPGDADAMAKQVEASFGDPETRNPYNRAAAEYFQDAFANAGAARVVQKGAIEPVLGAVKESFRASNISPETDLGMAENRLQLLDKARAHLINLWGAHQGNAPEVLKINKQLGVIDSKIKEVLTAVPAVENNLESQDLSDDFKQYVIKNAPGRKASALAAQKELAAAEKKAAQEKAAAEKKAAAEQKAADRKAEQDRKKAEKATVAEQKAAAKKKLNLPEKTGKKTKVTQPAAAEAPAKNGSVSPDVKPSGAAPAASTVTKKKTWKLRRGAEEVTVGDELENADGSIHLVIEGVSTDEDANKGLPVVRRIVNGKPAKETGALSKAHMKNFRKKVKKGAPAATGAPEPTVDNRGIPIKKKGSQEEVPPAAPAEGKPPKDKKPKKEKKDKAPKAEDVEIDDEELDANLAELDLDADQEAYLRFLPPEKRGRALAIFMETATPAEEGGAVVDKRQPKEWDASGEIVTVGDILEGPDVIHKDGSIAKGMHYEIMGSNRDGWPMMRVVNQELETLAEEEAFRPRDVLRMTLAEKGSAARERRKKLREPHQVEVPAPSNPEVAKGLAAKHSLAYPALMNASVEGQSIDASLIRVFYSDGDITAFMWRQPGTSGANWWEGTPEIEKPYYLKTGDTVAHPMEEYQGEGYRSLNMGEKAAKIEKSAPVTEQSKEKTAKSLKTRANNIYTQQQISKNILEALYAPGSLDEIGVWSNQFGETKHAVRRPLINRLKRDDIDQMVKTRVEAEAEVQKGFPSEPHAMPDVLVGDLYFGALVNIDGVDHIALKHDGKSVTFVNTSGIASVLKDDQIVKYHPREDWMIANKFLSDLTSAQATKKGERKQISLPTMHWLPTAAKSKAAIAALGEEKYNNIYEAMTISKVIESNGVMAGKNPFGKKFVAENYTKENRDDLYKSHVVSTSSVDAKVSTIFKGWMKTLGINANLFVFESGDVIGAEAAEKYGLYGIYARPREMAHILSQSHGVEIDMNEAFRKMGRKSYAIGFNSAATTDEQKFENMSHEFGHLIHNHLFETADAETKAAVLEEYNAWINGIQDKPADEVMLQLTGRVPLNAYTLDAKGNKLRVKTMKEMDPYASYLSEWMAWKSMQWLSTNQAATSVVEKFWQTIMAHLKKFLKIISKNNVITDSAVYSYLSERAAQVENDAKYQEEMREKERQAEEFFVPIQDIVDNGENAHPTNLSLWRSMTSAVRRENRFGRTAVMVDPRKNGPEGMVYKYRVAKVGSKMLPKTKTRVRELQNKSRYLPPGNMFVNMKTLELMPGHAGLYVGEERFNEYFMDEAQLAEKRAKEYALKQFGANDVRSLIDLMTVTTNGVRYYSQLSGKLEAAKEFREKKVAVSRQKETAQTPMLEQRPSHMREQRVEQVDIDAYLDEVRDLADMIEKRQMVDDSQRDMLELIGIPVEKVVPKTGSREPGILGKKIENRWTDIPIQELLLRIRSAVMEVEMNTLGRDQMADIESVFGLRASLDGEVKNFEDVEMVDVMTGDSWYMTLGADHNVFLRSKKGNQIIPPPPTPRFMMYDDYQHLTLEKKNEAKAMLNTYFEHPTFKQLRDAYDVYSKNKFSKEEYELNPDHLVPGMIVRPLTLKRDAEGNVTKKTMARGKMWQVKMNPETGTLFFHDMRAGVDLTAPIDEYEQYKSMSKEAREELAAKPAGEQFASKNAAEHLTEEDIKEFAAMPVSIKALSAVGAKSVIDVRSLKTETKETFHRAVWNIEMENGAPVKYKVTVDDKGNRVVERSPDGTSVKLLSVETRSGKPMKVMMVSEGDARFIDHTDEDIARWQYFSGRGKYIPTGSMAELKSKYFALPAVPVNGLVEYDGKRFKVVSKGDNSAVLEQTKPSVSITVPYRINGKTQVVNYFADATITAKKVEEDRERRKKKAGDVSIDDVATAIEDGQKKLQEQINNLAANDTKFAPSKAYATKFPGAPIWNMNTHVPYLWDSSAGFWRTAKLTLSANGSLSISFKADGKKAPLKQVFISNRDYQQYYDMTRLGLKLGGTLDTPEMGQSGKPIAATLAVQPGTVSRLKKEGIIPEAIADLKSLTGIKQTEIDPKQTPFSTEESRARAKKFIDVTNEAEKEADASRLPPMYKSKWDPVKKEWVASTWDKILRNFWELREPITKVMEKTAAGRYAIRKMTATLGASSMSLHLINETEAKIKSYIPVQWTKLFDKYVFALREIEKEDIIREREKMVDLDIAHKEIRLSEPYVVDVLPEQFEQAVEVRHMKGLTKADMESFLEAVRANPEMQEKFDLARQAYTDAMHNSLRIMHDSQVISTNLFHYLVKTHKYYSPSMMLQIIDPKGVESLTINANMRNISVGESGIQHLGGGSDETLLLDHSQLLEQVISRAVTRSLKNQANLGLMDFVEGFPANPLGMSIERNVTIDEGDVFRTKGEPLPDTMTRMNVRVNEGGRVVTHAIVMPKEVASMWRTSDPQMTSGLRTLFMWVSGAPIFKAFTTGYNPVWALTQWPIDQLYTMLRQPNSYYFEGSKIPRFMQSPIKLGKIAKDSAIEFKNLLTLPDTENVWLVRYVLNAGGMDTVTSQSWFVNSAYLKRFGNIGKNIQNVLTILGKPGNYSELSTRLGIFKRLSLDMIAKGKAPAEAYADAAFIARSNIDYFKGGSMIKSLDSFYPYINASQRAIYGLTESAKKDPKDFLYHSIWIAAFGMMMQSVLNHAWEPDDNDDDETKKKKLQARMNLEYPHWQTMKNSVIVPLGIPYVSKETDLWEFPYMKIKLDQYARLPYAIGRNIYKVGMGGTADSKELLGALGDASGLPNPIGGIPTSGAFAALMANFDASTGDKYYKRTPVSPYAEVNPNTPYAYKMLGAVGKAVSGVPGLGSVAESQTLGGVFSPVRAEAAVGKLLSRNPMMEALLYVAEIAGKEQNDLNTSKWEAMSKIRVAGSLGLGVARAPYVDRQAMIKDAARYVSKFTTPIGKDALRQKTTQELVDEIAYNKQQVNTRATAYIYRMQDFLKGAGDWQNDPVKNQQIYAMMEDLSKKINEGMELPETGKTVMSAWSSMLKMSAMNRQLGMSKGDIFKALSQAEGMDFDSRMQRIEAAE